MLRSSALRLRPWSSGLQDDCRMTRGPERAPEKYLAAFVDYKRNLSHQDPAAARKTNAILGSLNSSTEWSNPGKKQWV